MQKVEMYAPRASLSWNCVECLTQKLLVHREREMTVISRHHAGFVSSPIPWDACGTPTVKIRFDCTQNCKASQ